VYLKCIIRNYSREKSAFEDISLLGRLNQLSIVFKNCDNYNDTHNDSGVPQVDTSHDNVQIAEPPPHEYVTSKNC